MFKNDELKFLLREVEAFHLTAGEREDADLFKSLNILMRSYLYLLLIQKTPKIFRHPSYQKQIIGKRKAHRSNANRIWDTKIWGNNFSILANTYLLMVFELANLNQEKLYSLSAPTKEDFFLDWLLSLESKYNFLNMLFSKSEEGFHSDGFRKRIRKVRTQLRGRGVICLTLNLAMPYQGYIGVELATKKNLNRYFSNYIMKTLVVPLDLRIEDQFKKQLEFLAPLEPKKIASKEGAKRFFEKQCRNIFTGEVKLSIEDGFMLPSENDLKDFINIE